MDEPRIETLSNLIGRIHNGDPAAEEELVSRFSRGLLAMLRQRTGDRNLSDDLHQEAFLVLLAKLRSDPIAEPEQVKGYLHQIARNLVIAHFRKVKRHGIHDDGELAGLMAAPQSLPSVQLRGKRIVAKVHRLLGRMKKPRDRAVLLRFFLGRESREQISADMGLSVIQLNKILSRARSRFMEMWYKNGSDQ